MNDLDSPLDADVRPVLRARVREAHARDPETVVFDELGVCRGQVRIDLAVVNGEFHGFEIKSDRDSLRRIERQVAVYNKVLDRATLVVGDRYLDAAAACVPSWWGILRIGGPATAPRLSPVRKGRRNPSRDAYALVELLWLEHAIALLAARQLDRGIRGKPRRVVWDRVCEHLTIDEISSAVRAHLKETAGRRGSSQSP